jgi:hypothetical protein
MGRAVHPLDLVDLNEPPACVNRSADGRTCTSAFLAPPGPKPLRLGQCHGCPYADVPNERMPALKLPVHACPRKLRLPIVVPPELEYARWPGLRTELMQRPLRCRFLGESLRKPNGRARTREVKL